MERLRKRADFLRMMKGRKWVTPGLILQSLEQPAILAGDVRCGITVSRKVGGAVERNRARRRLRALANDVLAKKARSHHDYVLIGRVNTLTRSWELLGRDLETALAHIHGERQKSKTQTSKNAE